MNENVNILKTLDFLEKAQNQTIRLKLSINYFNCIPIHSPRVKENEKLKHNMFKLKEGQKIYYDKN